MKELIIKEHKILVDDEDYEMVSRFKWHISKTNKNNFYAMRHVVVNGKATKVYLHREILGNPLFPIDHKDQNGLNCQKENLRISDRSENGQNRRPYGAIPYLGVSIHKTMFRVQIYFKGKRYGGLYKTPEEAALVYNDYAKRLYGEGARLNQVSQ